MTKKYSGAEALGGENHHHHQAAWWWYFLTKGVEGDGGREGMGEERGWGKGGDGSKAYRGKEFLSTKYKQKVLNM